MRALVASMILACLAGTAMAQSNRTTAPGARAAQSDAGPGEAKRDDALASCLAQWEKATHMSRREWGRACRRVADRLQNLTVK